MAQFKCNVSLYLEQDFPSHFLGPFSEILRSISPNIFSLDKSRWDYNPPSFQPSASNVYGMNLYVLHTNVYIAALQEELQSKLYGQHLVTDVIIKHLKAHMMKDPSKALTLSFHGGTGTGKNYVSKIIAESIYKEGMRSKFVHLISSTKEFPHKDMVPLYKVNLMSYQSKISYVFQGLLRVIKFIVSFLENVTSNSIRKTLNLKPQHDQFDFEHSWINRC